VARGDRHRVRRHGPRHPHGRADQARRRPIENGTFCATYADGVADLDIPALIAFHRAHGNLATVTVVRPRSQFGMADLEGDRVTAFQEKPHLDHWVNGGFFCFQPGVLDYLEESSVLENEPLEQLAAAGQLRAYRHYGFWDCMETYKDAVMLNDLWKSSEARWRIWERAIADGAPTIAAR
jgi:glucose-1-phosphate cytidylyltransferase